MSKRRRVEVSYRELTEDEVDDTIPEETIVDSAPDAERFGKNDEASGPRDTGEDEDDMETLDGDDVRYAIHESV